MTKGEPMTNQATLLREALRRLADADSRTLEEAVALLRRRQTQFSTSGIRLQRLHDLEDFQMRRFGIVDPRHARELWLRLLKAQDPAVIVYLEDGIVRATADEVHNITFETSGYWLLPASSIIACAQAMLRREENPSLRQQLSELTESQRTLLIAWAPSLKE